MARSSRGRLTQGAEEGGRARELEPGNERLRGNLELMKQAANKPLQLEGNLL